MEVTAYLADKVASISCIDITAVPFERVLGSRIGRVLQEVRPLSLSLSSLWFYLVRLILARQMHQENGVKFYLSAGVKEIVGDEEGKVKGVTLPSGETLEADIVIAGVGKLYLRL